MGLHHIAFGSNLGARGAHLAAAVAALAQHGRVVALSPCFDTAALGGSPHRYLNAAVALESALAAEALLPVLLAIESEHGRTRQTHWGDRTMDLDLLLSEGRVVATPGCTVPHPGLSARVFVLAPLSCIAPRLLVPGAGTVQALFAARVAAGEVAGVAFAEDALAPAPFACDAAALSACRTALAKPV